MNLLPLKDKKIISKEYTMRFVSLLLRLVFLSALAGLVLLIPSYFFSFSKAEVLQTQLAGMQTQDGSVAYVDIQSLVREINAKIGIFGSTDNSLPLPTEIISQITILRGNNIKITGIAYDGAVSPALVSIDGISADRQNLLDFTERLKNAGKFSKVELPISDFVANHDINFSIKISL